MVIFDHHLLVGFNGACFYRVITDILDLILVNCRYCLQLFVSVDSYVHVYTSGYAGCVGTVIDLQTLYAILDMLCNDVHISGHIFLACIALEVKVGKYMEIITSLHKGHTSLVIDQSIGEFALGSKQLVVIKKNTYN